MKKTAAVILCLLCSLGAFSQSRTQRLVEEAASREPFASGLWGVKAMTLSGEVIADYNSGKRFVPASNVKILSTGLAMDKFGPDYRFDTFLGYNGSVEEGVLTGDLYIVGTGDPSLGLGSASVVDGIFAAWRDILKSNGINEIDGRIVADHRYIGEKPVNSSWQMEDIRCGDGLELRGLNYARNVREIAKLYRPGFVAVESPHDTCARAFLNYLEAHEFKTGGYTADDRDPLMVPQDSLVILGKTRSERLSVLAKHTNHTSDNFYAEAMLNAVLRDCKLDDAFRSYGIEPRPLCRIVDGCGLSRKDYVSPSFFCDFLALMAGKSCFKAFLGSLPQPGNGTLAVRLPKASKGLKSRIYMKSGSMNGVRCFSGYVLPSSEDGQTIVFSLLTNNMDAPSKTVFDEIDGIIESIASEN